MRYLIVFIAFAVALAFAGSKEPAYAANSKTPADLGLTLQVPDAYRFANGNWSSDKDQGPFLAFAGKPPQGVVMLEVDPRDGRSLDDFVHFPNVFDAPLLATATPTTICNGTQPALLVIDDRNDKLYTRSIAAVGVDHAAVVQYTRERTAPDDPAVLAAFAAMCLK